VKLGEDWSDLNYAADLLEETRKTLISKLANECGETSMAAKDNYALRQGAYDEHVRKMVAARRDANKAKVQYDSAKIWAELKRTEAANERAANRSAT
jgi:phosphoribosyl-ATP pyrophosphohydrolase